MLRSRLEDSKPESMLVRAGRLVHKRPKRFDVMRNPKIPAKVVTELSRQLNQELGAAHGYRALSLWCGDQNLKGFASYFAKQVGEEQAHAGKIMDHLNDRGVVPELAAIAAPKQSFKSLLEVA